MNTPEYILQKYWGYSQFRSSQREIINAALEKKDILALLPTGGGKSICFQVPTLLMDGLCIVVTPLIALMHDQISQLKKKAIPAVAIHSGMGGRGVDIALDNCVYGSIKFLYLSPERIHNELFVERVKKMKVSLIAVDEAHCISEWGYNFRPSYLRIADLRVMKPTTPVMALTATATKEVREDMVVQLHLQNVTLFQKSIARNNLSFAVRKTENKEKKLIEILQKVKGAAIVYVRSRKKAEKLAQELNEKDILSTFYHAGLTYAERSDRQKQWIEGSMRVVVSTNAFGMGIDKADVRSVIHLDIPETLEAYYQEAGRAGRDGKKSYAVMVYHEADIKALQNKVAQSHPEPDVLKKIYQALANYLSLAIGSAEGESFDFDLYDFCTRFAYTNAHAYAALKKLEQQGFIQFSDGYYKPCRISIQVDKQKLYTLQVANERYDQLTKALLRLYGAELFSDFTIVSEAQLSRSLEWSASETRNVLQSLHALQILYYEPSSNSPQITFTTARLDAEKLPLNKKQLEAHKKRSLHSMNAIIAYTQSTHRCRMQVMQSYFDEETFNVCGVCDVCIEKKKHEFGDVSYKKQILELLTHRPMKVEELEQEIAPGDCNLLVREIREMLDSSVIKYDEYWVLRKT